MVKWHQIYGKELFRQMPPPHGLLFPISSMGFFYMHNSTDRTPHTMAFVTPVVEHWLEQDITQWVHHEGSIRQPITP